jgi:solute carrier family 25 (mitochondrial phosphate transporter), member 23/24/25/41
VVISDEAIVGLGNKFRTFLSPFFRLIVEIAIPPVREYPPQSYPAPQHLTPPSSDEEPHPSHYLPPKAGGMLEVTDVAPADVRDHERAMARRPGKLPASGSRTQWNEFKAALYACLPTPGYFAAGGLAGAVSRTTTAPLDRLKVYLIAQTGTTQEAINAAKSGSPIYALRAAWRTTASAQRDLWAAGGIRSLWAGKFWSVSLLSFADSHT